VSSVYPTAVTPVPPGTSLSPPPGFQLVTSSATGIAYANLDTDERILLAPLIPGTNDPKLIAEAYAKQNSAEIVTSDTTPSAGEARPAVILKQDVGGAIVGHVLVMYISPKWRHGVLYMGPQGACAALQRCDEFYRTGIHLP